MNNYLDIGGYFTMKKIIGGKLYDTETAIRIGECNNGEMPTSFHYQSETLYRKKNGEFFLLIDGVPEKSSGYYITTCKIEKINLEHAKEWCELNLSGEEYMDVFGQVNE